MHFKNVHVTGYEWYDGIVGGTARIGGTDYPFAWADEDENTGTRHYEVYDAAFEDFDVHNVDRSLRVGWFTEADISRVDEPGR